MLEDLLRGFYGWFIALRLAMDLYSPRAIARRAISTLVTIVLIVVIIVAGVAIIVVLVISPGPTTYP